MRKTDEEKQEKRLEKRLLKKDKATLKDLSQKLSSLELTTTDLSLKAAEPDWG